LGRSGLIGWAVYIFPSNQPNYGTNSEVGSLAKAREERMHHTFDKNTSVGLLRLVAASRILGLGLGPSVADLLARPNPRMIKPLSIVNN